MNAEFFRNPENVAWLAGYLEGEGCFSLKQGYYPHLQVTATDQDVIEKVGRVFKRVVYGPRKYITNKKPYWTTCVSGIPALSVMLALFPWLGWRRRRKIADLLTVWEHRTLRGLGGPLEKLS